MGMLRRLQRGRRWMSLASTWQQSSEAGLGNQYVSLAGSHGADEFPQGPAQVIGHGVNCAMPASGRHRPTVAPGHISASLRGFAGDTWSRSLHSWEQQAHVTEGGHGHSGVKRDPESVVLCQRISKARDAEELAHLIGLHEDSLNYFSLSAAFARLPKVLSGSQHPQATGATLLNNLVDRSIDMVEDLDDVAVAIMLWSLAKLRCTREDILMELEAVLPLHLPFMRAQSISNTVWALGTLNRPQSPDIVPPLLRAIQQNLKFFNSQGVANVVWGMAHLGYGEDRSLLLLLEQRATELVQRSLTTQDAKSLGSEPSEHSAAQARAPVSRVQPQEVANLLWGFATLRHPASQRFLDVALEHCQQHVQVYKPQELSNFCWALAAMYHLGAAQGCNPAPLLTAVEQTSVQRISHFRAQELASLLHSFAVIVPALARDGQRHLAGQHEGQAGELLLEKSCSAICQGYLTGLNPQAISNIMWSLATMRHLPTSPALERLLQEAERQGFSLFTDQAISNILWACGELNHHPAPSVLVKAIGELLSRPQLPPQAVGCSLWALAVLDAVTPKVFGALASRANVADPVTLCQIWQAYASLEQSTEHTWPPEVQRAIEAAQNAQLQSIIDLRNAPGNSNNHKEVLLALETMGVPHANEVRVGTDGLRLADVLLDTNPPLAIEIDGPLHYASNKQRYPLGGTVLRNRMLERGGIPVITVHWLDWQAASNNMTQQQQMLTREIKHKYQLM